MKRIMAAVLICVLLIPLCSVLKPVYAANGSSISRGVRSISVTWIVNTPSYKEALATVELEEGIFNFHVIETVLNDGLETYVDLTLTDSEGNEIRIKAAIPDTLTDAPPSKSMNVEAWRLDIPGWAVVALRLILLAAVIVLVVYLVVATLNPLLDGDLWGFFNGLGGFVWASIPWVLLTLLGDANDDGSVTLFFPHSPIDYVVGYLSDLRYVVATALNWWEINKKSAGFLFFYWEWYEATWLYSRAAIEIPNVSPSASFRWFPEKPFALDTVSSFSTSFDPDGYIADYHWSFGDGYEAFARNVTHEYSRAGNYNVTLEVLDDASQLATASAIVTVMAPAEFDLEPDVLISNGRYRQVTGYIELPEEFSASDINISSLFINSTVPVENAAFTIDDYDNDTILEMIVGFNKTAICDFVLSKTGPTKEVILTINGQLYDGTSFEGSSVIGVRMPGDVNMDGIVDILDLVTVGEAFGSNPEHVRWNSAADEKEDGLIDIFDLVLVCNSFGIVYA